MSITASEARKGLLPLIKKVNEDHDAIEIVSKHGNAFLVSAEDYAALREGAYLLRSPSAATAPPPLQRMAPVRQARGCGSICGGHGPAGARACAVYAYGIYQLR